MITQKIKTLTKPIMIRDDIVILSMSDYQNLCLQSFPIYYLKGKNAKKIDHLVNNGLKSYNNKKCVAIKSLANLD